MLRYFIQEFHGYLIRIGPQANKYGDPYLWSIPLTDAGEFCGVSTNLLERSVVKTAIRAAHELGFTEPFWARIKEGKIIMKKSKKDRAKGREHLPHIQEAMREDGSMDVAAMEAALPEVVAAIKAGKLKILSGHQIDLPNNEDLLILHRKHS